MCWSSLVEIWRLSGKNSPDFLNIHHVRPAQNKGVEGQMVDRQVKPDLRGQSSLPGGAGVVGD